MATFEVEPSATTYRPLHPPLNPSVILKPTSLPPSSGIRLNKKLLIIYRLSRTFAKVLS